MSKLFIGGQAVIEGVMMRTKTHYAVAVRRPDGSISRKRTRISPPPKLLQLPFLRGSVVLVETLVIGMRALMYSANESSGEDEQLGRKDMFFTFLVAGVFAVALFVALPLFIATLTAKGSTFIFNVVDGLIRVLVFLLYLAAISFIPDVRRMFEYHGAEHMTVHAHEHGLRLVPSEIRKFPTMHPRCGTSFLLIVLLVSVAVFSFLTHPSFFVKFFGRLALFPVVAGISYELLRSSAKVADSMVGRLIIWPGVALQYITTKQPNKKQMEVAVAALQEVIRSSR